MVEPLPIPADFAEYWEAVRREAEELPLEPEVRAWDPGGEARVPGMRLWRVGWPSAGGVRVGGILHTPEAPEAVLGGRRLPALLHLPGYGGELVLHQDLVAAGFVVLDVSHRGMKWGSEGFDRERPRPLLVRDVEDRHRYVYRFIYQDCLLALRFLRQHPLVDAERIGVLGTSQGGGLTIGLAVLGGVRAAAADIPWLTHFAHQLAGPVDGPYNELKALLRERPDLEGAVRATLAYYDTTSFALHLRVPTLISLGQEDRVCPPESVRALFARIPACKALLEVPGLGHVRSVLWRRLALDWLRMWV
jgi:cephalosporin-C deacetylase